MTTPLFLLRCVQLGISIADLDLLTIGWSMICSRNGRTTTIRTKSWPRKLILTNFDRIKLDERAYIKCEISTLV